MGLRRRRRTGGSQAAAADAVVSREKAEAELERQRALRDAEHLDTLTPLRRMRDKNHLAEMFIRTIEEGYRR
jgi:uncharacterized membrane protein YqiK